MARNDKYMSTGGGITYDSRSAGGKGFGKADIEELRNQGYSDKKIGKVAANVDSSQLGAGAQVALGLDKDVDYTDLENYNPHSVGQGNKPDMKKIEIKQLMKEGGHSAQAINDMVKEKGYTLGDGAQKFLNKRLTSMTGNPPTDVTAEPGTPANEIIDTKPVTTPTTETKVKDSFNTDTTIRDSGNTKVATDISQQQSQVVGSDKFKNNEYNVSVGGDSLGGISVGNDYSVNIAGQSQEAGSGSDGSSTYGLGFKDGALSNFASGAAATGLLENSLARSGSQFTRTGAAASAKAAKTTGADDRIAGLDYVSRMNPHIMGAKADMAFLGAFGDYHHPEFANRDKGGYDWNRAAAPELPEIDFEKQADKYLNKL